MCEHMTGNWTISLVTQPSKNELARLCKNLARRILACKTCLARARDMSLFLHVSCTIRLAHILQEMVQDFARVAARIFLAHFLQDLARIGARLCKNHARKDCARILQESCMQDLLGTCTRYAIFAGKRILLWVKE